MPLSPQPLKILIADDEKELRESISAALQHMGFQTVLAVDGEDAVEKAQAENFSIAILDVNMPKKSGIEALRAIKGFDPSVLVLMITAHGNVTDAVEALKEGAFNYIEKPVKEDHLRDLVERASRTHQAVQNVAFSNPTLRLEDGQDFVGHSRQMKSVFQLIQRLANVSTSVLIRGENGTGKELVASAIHQYGPRKDKRFVAVNCGAIPEALMESELFGHEKGAFTGANARHIGKFQYAEGGTLFLDEVGELAPQMQVKLLRVLQNRTFTPVGSNREIRCDVRIIAATNRDLEKMIREGEFRQDLFYRLNVMPIFLPPLRERADDVPALVDHFVRKFNALHGRQIAGIEAEALAALRKHDWPGNIRELENAVERAFIMETGARITLRALPEQISGISPADALATPAAPPEEEPSSALDIAGIDFQVEKEEFERQFIIHALKRFGGRINQTVAHANIPKNTLLRKIRKYEIRPWEYGGPEILEDHADVHPDETI
ncbi:MAG: sigma-54-dependent Fis family transcriptional regulator [Bdellovibrionales bacterium]|nr:sigma-54-dependent Fis family transcriptional regulator [Bdellovibrionales bacterium]